MEMLIEFLSIREIRNPINRISREQIFSFFRIYIVSSYLDVSVGAYRVHITIQKTHMKLALIN